MKRIIRLWINLAVGMMLMLLFAVSANAQPIEQWVARYDGPAFGFDDARALAVDAAGNVYVTGQSAGSGTSHDYATIKYDANGNELWVARYDGSAHGHDGAYALTVDAAGNVYVTGGSEGSGPYSDYATVKYDANGNELWVARYDGPAHGSDYAVAMAVDAEGNVYVTGASDSTISNADYATVKYDADGNELWVARYDGPAQTLDEARALAVDAAGNVYVTGASVASGSSRDYTTIKYNADGNELWVARYDGPAHDTDEARALAVDAAGNVYVTGSSYGSGTFEDYAIVKYDTNGNELWVVRYDGPAHYSDAAQALAVDAAGSVYVTGHSTGSGTSVDYATVKYDADGNEIWLARYDSPAHGGDGAFALAVEAAGNVYVTGNSAGSGVDNPDYATVKYDASGNQLWVARYDGPAHDQDAARALVVDAAGNVYVTGDSYGNGTSEDRDDYATIKYVEDSDGDGIPDSRDSCPNEDATGFDADNNGCIDSFNGLSELVSKLVLEEVIDTTMQNSLLSKVANAGNSFDRDNVCAAINQLEAFKNQVSSQTGKKISADAATEVVDYANSIIAYQQSLLSDGESCQ